MQWQNEGWVRKLGKRKSVVTQYPKAVHEDRAYQTEKAVVLEMSVSGELIE